MTDYSEELKEVRQHCWSETCKGEETSHRHYIHTVGGGGIIDILDTYECKICHRSGCYTL